MISYRTFRNSDPPHLLELWHAAGLARGAALGITQDAFEMSVFASLCFDPRGLVLAECDGRVVGFCHAGFAARADETAMDPSRGIICAVMVHPEFRRRGIGRALVARVEQFLRERGAAQILAGAAAPNDPFYTGIYGGAANAGFLRSDAAAEPFFAALGYLPRQQVLVFQRPLRGYRDPVDFRMTSLRRQTQLAAGDCPDRLTWWWAVRYSRWDTLQFMLLSRQDDELLAQVTLIGLDCYMPRWRERAIGLRELKVPERHRRKGYAKLLLCEVFKKLRDESITLAELHVGAENMAGLALMRSLEMQPIDVGVVYERP
jgi:GNAT superfamily N-acetyltransferase